MNIYLLQGHAGIKNYTCDICSKKFTTKKYLRDHQVIHTSAKPYKCKTCNADFNQYSNLKRHEKIHSDFKKYKCKFCDRRFKYINSVRYHEGTHTGFIYGKCEKCGLEFRSRPGLKSHKCKGHKNPDELNVEKTDIEDNQVNKKSGSTRKVTKEASKAKMTKKKDSKKSSVKAKQKVSNKKLVSVKPLKIPKKFMSKHNSSQESIVVSPKSKTHSTKKRKYTKKSAGNSSPSADTGNSSNVLPLDVSPLRCIVKLEPLHLMAGTVREAYCSYDSSPLNISSSSSAFMSPVKTESCPNQIPSTPTSDTDMLAMQEAYH